MFAGFRGNPGQRRHGNRHEKHHHLVWRRTTKEVWKANETSLTEAEILVGLFDKAFEDGLWADSPALRDRLRRYTWTPPGRPPRQFTDEQVSAVCAGWSDMLRAWNRLSIGGTLDLDWPEK